MDDIKLEGKWLNPKIGNVVGGTLQYSESGGIKLETFDPIDGDPTNIGSGVTITYDRIIGHTKDNDKITLVKCHRESYSGGLGLDGRSEVYNARVLLNGAVFDRQNPAFDKLKVSFPLLDQWAQLASPRPTFDISNSSNVSAGDEFGAKITLPENKEMRIGDTKIILSIDGDTNISKYKSAGVDISTEFIIEPKRPFVPFSEYLDHIKKLQDFVTFVTDDPVSPSYVEGILFPDDANRKTNIDIYYPPQPNDVSPGTKHPNHMLFTLPEIENEYEEIMANWYEMVDSFEIAINQYFAVRNNQLMYPRNKLLNLTQSIEAYHRRNYEGEYLSEYKFSELYDAMCEFMHGDLSNVYDNSGTLQNTSVIPNPNSVLKNMHEAYNLDGDFRNHMKGGTLKYANEYSLRKRLGEMIDEKSNILNGLPHSIMGKKGLIIDTRNYYTHYDKGLKDDAADGDQVQRLVWSLQQLVEVMLLSELDIDGDRIAGIMTTKYNDLAIV